MLISTLEHSAIDLSYNPEFYPAYLLSELIEILGDREILLLKRPVGWNCTVTTELMPYVSSSTGACGENPIQAVYNVFIKLHKEGLLFNGNKNEQ